MKRPFWNKRKAFDRAGTASVGDTDLQLLAFMLGIFVCGDDINLGESVPYCQIRFFKNTYCNICLTWQAFVVKSTTLIDSYCLPRCSMVPSVQ